MFFTWSSAEGMRGELDPRMPSARFAGDGGRLAKWSTTGVMGVLDGRVPRSTGRTGKDLLPTLGERSAGGCELPDHGVDLLTELPELSERGSMSVVVRRPSISSSSSMEGNAWANSTGVTKDVRGDEEAEDVGDGGPKAEGDTNE